MTEMKNSEGPVDRFNVIYLIFYWLGIGTLLPWNMFISVGAYWMHKFRTVPEYTVPDLPVLAEVTEGSGLEPLTDSLNATQPADMNNELQNAWTGYLAVASMIPNVTFLILNGFFGHKFKTQPRLIVSLILVILLFIFTSVMVKVDTDSWQSSFLTLTLASVVVINVGAAIFQGGILGVAGKFPPKYMGAVFGGQAVGGIFASGTNVVVLLLGATPVQSAFFCFVISVVFLGTALVAYAIATRSEFYKHYLGEGEPADTEVEKSKMLKEGGDSNGVKMPAKVNTFGIILQISVYAAAVLLTFFVTLGCFPAITFRVKSTLEGSAWATTFFIPVSCFVLFNVGDYIGRFLAEKVQWPKPGKMGGWITLVMALSRFVFIPLFLICNIPRVEGDGSLTPTLIRSDVGYIIIMLLFSITNGYVGSICMMSGPQIVRSEEAQTAASLMVAFLGIGLASGAFMSNIFTMLI